MDYEIAFSGDQTSIITDFSCENGIQPLYFRFTGTGAIDFYGFDESSVLGMT